MNGVAKAYRVACLDEIGGLRPSMGWDGIDEYGARAHGWHVRVLTELTLLHYRPRGSKQKPLKARWEEGRGNAYMGYLPSWLLVRAAYRSLVEKPSDRRRPRAARRLRLGAHPAAAADRRPGCARRAARRAASAARGPLPRPGTPALERAGRHRPGVLGDRARRAVIDLHSHLLPGIDDGAPDLEHALELARAAAEQGTRVLAATPHLRADFPDVHPDELASRGATRSERRSTTPAIELEVVQGGEAGVMWAVNASDDELRAGSYGGRGTDLLVETPYGPLNDTFEQLLFTLPERGYRLLLAHPENNPTFQRSPERLHELVDRGVLLQVTARSLIRSDRKRGPRPLAEALVRDGRVARARVRRALRTPAQAARAGRGRRGRRRARRRGARAVAGRGRARRRSSPASRCRRRRPPSRSQRRRRRLLSRLRGG